MEDFAHELPNGERNSVSVRNGVGESLYEALIILATRRPTVPYRQEVARFLQRKLDCCPNGGRGFTINWDDAKCQPVGFWRCFAELIAQLADEELGKASPSEDWAINWEDDARCHWRKWLEELYSLINSALPEGDKLPSLKPWTYLPVQKLTPDPPLEQNEFKCFNCGKAYIRKNDLICPVCGALWNNVEPP